MTFAGSVRALRIITSPTKRTMRTSITHPIARLRVLSRSACKSENIVLFPFASCSQRCLLLSICTRYVVSGTCQIQEELFQRRVLRCHLVDFGSCVDQC